MNLQLTKSLSDKLKPTLVEIDTSKYSDIDNYHCNFIDMRGVDCILITNDKTLFSFFIYDVDFENFIETIQQSVFKILLSMGFPQNQFEKVLESMETINYSKTSDRSVISVMNDMKRHIEVGLIYYEDSILEVNERINEIPYKRNNHRYSVELFSELLKG
ncbi:MAG: hypothetical protein NTW78_06120 [Campylobacterales bacterium]|nr:hypothetical protein [Campylobacterales bacterium]